MLDWILTSKVGRRLGKLVLWLVVFGTLLALAYQVAAWRGASSWRDTTVRLKVEGEVFTIEDLAPSPVADSDNFCAIPLLRGIGIVDDGDAETGAHADRRKRLSELLPTAGHTADGTPRKRKTEPRLWDYGSHSGVPIDFSAWWFFAHEGEEIAPGVVDDPAGAWITEWDADHGEVFFDLAGAMGRPYSQFIPPFHELARGKNMFAVEVPHYKAVLNAAKAVALRGAAGAQTGDGETATASARIVSQLGRANLGDPIILSTLVAVPVGTLAESVLWEGLQARVFSPEELGILQTEFASIDLRNALLDALRGELIGALDALAIVEQEGGSTVSTLIPLEGGETASGAMFGRFFPGGWIDQNRATYANWVLEYQILPLRDHGFTGILDAWKEFELKLEGARTNYWKLPHTLIACLIMPATGPLAGRVAYREAKNRQCVIACALERFFLLQGRYPETLGELVPEFIEAVPADPLDGAPMRYRREGARYRIWSVGSDRSDDGGIGGDGGHRPAHEAFKGDWVWRYRAQSEEPPGR